MADDILYFDAFSGLAGDMIIGALLELVPNPDSIIFELRKFETESAKIEVRKTTRKGIAATDFGVRIAGDHHHAHFHSEEHGTSHLIDIIGAIDASSLTTSVKTHAKAIFERLAKAEAEVHGIEVEKVHFHEVGSIDAIIDICGFALLYEALGAPRLVCSPLPQPSGFVKTQHGMLPLPAPASAVLLRNVPVYGVDLKFELVTPTGAAIVANTAAGFGTMPAMTISKIGHGAGDKDLEHHPNILRAFLGSSGAGADAGTVLEGETNIDDMSFEGADLLMTRLFEAGALDVWFTSIQMKKSRPGVKLSVLCPDIGARLRIESVIFAETTTIGVRWKELQRTMLPRRFEYREVSGVKVAFKVLTYPDGGTRAFPEHDDVVRLATTLGIPYIAAKSIADKSFQITN
ncbi:MAG: nickel pincer cofactor biosynthesis protein LarC [Planctomycetes bacterium]|nr:nickel pincer cofactor biosynthesis protein LarC [Planctomycetota bacterium]